MAITLDGTNGVTTPNLTVDTTKSTVQNGGSVSAPAYGIITGALGVNGTYVPAANTLGFVAGGAERGRFTANGLTFNGDTAAVNALDDYEEGTWTPAVSTASSHSVQTGIYTKIGNLVTIQCVIAFVQSGTVFGSVSGLPFTVSTINYSGVTFREWYSTGVTLSGHLTIGAQSTSGFWNHANSSAAVNAQTYGYGFSVSYRT
jgi:hypothetical protein